MQHTDTQQPIVAITGANGFLGTALVDYFATNGWQVYALVRKPADQKHASNNVTYKAYDITKKPDATLLQGVQLLVHAAYVKYNKQNADALGSNLTGARHLLDNSRRNKVAKNIFISTMSAHEEAVSVYGRQKLAVEALFTEPDNLVLRCGLIIGNGGIVKDMASFMRKRHMVPVIGGGNQPLQIIAVYDLVHAIEQLAHSKAHGVFTVAHPTVYSYKNFYRHLAKRLGIKVLMVPIPFSMLLYAFKTAALLRLPLDVGEDNLMGLKMLRSVDTAKDLKTLGLKLDDLDTALEKTQI